MVNRIRKVMHVFKGEQRHSARRVAPRKLWKALHAVDKVLRRQAASLVNYARRHHACLRVGTAAPPLGAPDRAIDKNNVITAFGWTGCASVRSAPI